MSKVKDRLLLGDDQIQDPDSKNFAWGLSLNTWVIIWTCFTILAFMGQLIFMPITLFTLGGATGGYPTVLILSCFFNFVYWPVVLFKYRSGQISKQTIKCISFKHRIFRYIIYSGLFNALNGIFVIFCSSPARTPPVLQPILVQSLILFTFVISKTFLKKRYNTKQYICALVVFGGIMVSLIPTFIQIAQGGAISFQNGIGWGVLMFFSPLPAALMNIFEEHIFDEVRSFDVVVFNAFNSLFQFISVVFLFWLDIIPGFGTSSNFGVFWDNFTGGFNCLVNAINPEGSQCQYAAIFMACFALSYCVTLVFQAYLIKYASANFNAFISSVVSPMSSCFWILFPSVNNWIGGSPIAGIDVLFYLISFAIIIPTSFLFKKSEMSDKTRRLAELGRSLIEDGEQDSQL